MKKIKYAFVPVFFIYASLSAAVVITDTQTWNSQQDVGFTTSVTGNVTLNDPAWPANTLRIDPGGDLTITIRTNVSATANNFLILNGGILRTTADFKASDDPGNLESRLLINSGEWLANNIESDGAARNAFMIIKDGVVWVETQPSADKHSVNGWLENGFLEPADGYELVFQDFDGGVINPADFTGLNDSIRISAAVIPEPATVSILAGLACLGLVLSRRMRR